MTLSSWWLVGDGRAFAIWLDRDGQERAEFVTPEWLDEHFGVAR